MVYKEKWIVIPIDTAIIAIVDLYIMDWYWYFRGFVT